MDLKELQNTRIILEKHLDSKNLENIDSREVRQKKLLNFKMKEWQSFLRES